MSGGRRALVLAVGIVAALAPGALLRCGLVETAAAQDAGVPSIAAGPWPFAFMQPDVVVDRTARRTMNAREVVARTLDADDQVVSLFAASAIEVDGPRFLAKLRDIEALRTSKIVPTVRRFSSPPAPGDLADLRLEAKDLDAVASCEPGDCGLKLTAGEIRRLRAAIDRAGGGWRPVAQAEFRRVVLERVRAYLERGRSALAPYHDHEDPVDPAGVFAGLIGGLGFLRERYPAFAEHVERYPVAPLELVDSFLYWSIEDYAPRPIVTVWHDLILRGPGRPGEPELLVVSSQVMATHYLDGAMAVTALVRDEADPDRRYLAYVNRVSVDLLGGVMGGVRRFFLERRLRSDGRNIFAAQRSRLEGREERVDDAE